MKQWDEQGNVIVTVLLTVALVGALAFAGWAYAGRQDYKTNVDQKINAAVAVAKAREDSAKDTAFAEAEKNPLKTYNGPEAYGSIALQYPKTWSGYVDTTGGNAAVDGYFQPGVVPGIGDQSQTYALRLQVLSQQYADVLNQYSGLQQQGKVKVAPYALPNVSKVVGVRIDGAIEENKSGSIVILPLRDKTLQIFTESQDYENDFNGIILKNLTFAP